MLPAAARTARSTSAISANPFEMKLATTLPRYVARAIIVSVGEMEFLRIDGAMTLRLL